MTQTDPLVEALLSKPVGPSVVKAPTDREFTKQIEVVGDTAAVTVRGETVLVDSGDQLLVEQGLDPSEWESTGFRSSEWTMPSGKLGASVRFTFRRTAKRHESIDIDALVDRVLATEPDTIWRADGDYGYIVALGDMQWGKIDGDGVEGTLRRALDYIDKAHDLWLDYAERFDIGHVHVAWLGDHVEGFVSQGGANAWRTTLTMSEQIRLTRRLMLYALESFAPLVERVTMAAVPGNHGEPQRFAGKGVTRYDDSHDTESLIAVADAAKMNPGAYGHVQFYVPRTDEMTVVLDVAGTSVGHVHGHQWRPGKHFDWWRGQAFNTDSLLGGADLLLAGHLHHEFMEGDGKRLFLQVPSLEFESTWFRHATGTGGNPGLIVALTKDGVTSPVEVVR